MAELTGSVIAEIAAERRSQIDKGCTPEHDDGHGDNDLSMAAVSYIIYGRRRTVNPPLGWPWGPEWWNPKDRRRNLVRAAALIVAEIDRLDRKEADDG